MPNGIIDGFTMEEKGDIYHLKKIKQKVNLVRRPTQNIAI